MEILLGALAEAIFGVLIADLAQQPRLAALRDKLRGDSPEKLALQRALAAAYAAFSREYPALVAAFFDEHFLQKSEVVAELAKTLTPNRFPDKSIMGQLWRAQFRYEPHVDLHQPLTDFLDALENEVKAQPLLKPFVDSRAFEQLYIIAERAEDQIIVQTQMRDLLREIRELIEQGQEEEIRASQQLVSPKIGEAVRILPPVDTSHFTGRSQELNALVNLILQQHDQGRAVVGLWGGPGVGKSALARHFAEEYAEQFPDGVIGLDTRNKDAKRLALDFAALIGEPVDPESELEPSAIMQSRFAKRRTLLILDNVDRADIQKLMPDGCCAVIVTTRDRDLLDHVGVPREAQIRLHRFEEDESITFLGRLVGERAVQNEEDSARELTRLVGGLPLALRIAGASLRSQFLLSNPFAHYVDEFRDEKSRLHKLKWRDVDELNVLAMFRLSRSLLSSEEHATFACLAVCTESGFGLSTAAATVGLDENITTRNLSRLVSLALLNFAPESGRFRFHPLLHLFARHEAEELHLWSEAQERHAAFFVTYVRGRQSLSRQNLSDMEAEQDAILQTARWKIEHGDMDIPFWHGLRNLLEHRGHWQAGIELMQGYLALAERIGADSTAAHFHLQLGKYALLLGQFDETTAALQRSLGIFEELDDQQGVAMVLNSLGGALRAKGQLDEAIANFRRSLHILEELDDQQGVAMVLNSLGGALRAKGRLDEAIVAFRRSLDIGEELGDQRCIAIVLNSLGGMLQAKGRLNEAIVAFRRSLDILEDMGDRRSIAMVLNSLGGTLQAKGKFDEAIATFQRSLDIGEELDDQRQIAIVLNSLGGALRAKGRFDEAIATFQRSLDIGEELDDQRQIAMVLNSLGGTLQTKGQLDEAIAAFQCSLDIWESLGDRWGVAIVLKSLGGALRAKSQLDEAIAALRCSLDIGEELGDPRHIAMVRRSLRKARSWKESFEKWRAGKENELTAIDHRRVGKHLMRRRNFEAAFHHFMAALDLGIEAAEVGRLSAQAGEAAFRLEDHETAVILFRRAIVLGEDTSFTNACLGRALYELQEVPETIQQHFERALLLDDRNAWAHNWFSTFLKETGNIAEAEVHARRAVELRPRNAVFLNNLALILMEYGDRAHLLEAQVLLQEAVTCAPSGFIWPQQSLQIVKRLLNQTYDQDAADADTA